MFFTSRYIVQPKKFAENSLKLFIKWLQNSGRDILVCKHAYKMKVFVNTSHTCKVADLEFYKNGQVYYNPTFISMIMESVTQSKPASIDLTG